MLSAPLNRHSPSTKYTTVRAGSSQRRFSRHPARSITSSTKPGLISPVSTPSPTGHDRSGPRSQTGGPRRPAAESGNTGMAH